MKTIRRIVALVAILGAVAAVLRSVARQRPPVYDAPSAVPGGRLGPHRRRLVRQRWRRHSAPGAVTPDVAPVASVAMPLAGESEAAVHEVPSSETESRGGSPEPVTSGSQPPFRAAPQRDRTEAESGSRPLADLPAWARPEAAEDASPRDETLTQAFEDLASEGAPAVPPPAEAEPPLPSSLEEALTGESAEPVPTITNRDAESYLDEGNVYFNVGQFGMAIDRYTKAVELDPELTAAYYNRANAHTRAGDYKAALEDYNRALELQPTDADALNNRGMLQLYRADYAAAVKDFDAALAEDPTDTTVMVNRGLAHLHGGAPASALVDFQEAATRNPNDAAAHYGSAQAAAVLENHDGALQSLARALELDPSFAREAAGDPRLASLQGDSTFIKLLRDAGARKGDT